MKKLLVILLVFLVHHYPVLAKEECFKKFVAAADRLCRKEPKDYEKIIARLEAAKYCPDAEYDLERIEYIDRRIKQLTDERLNKEKEQREETRNNQLRFILELSKTAYDNLEHRRSLDLLDTLELISKNVAPNKHFNWSDTLKKYRNGRIYFTYTGKRIDFYDSARKIFIVNERNNLSVYDDSSMRVISSLPIGKSPRISKDLRFISIEDERESAIRLFKLQGGEAGFIRKFSGGKTHSFSPKSRYFYYRDKEIMVIYSMQSNMQVCSFEIDTTVQFPVISFIGPDESFLSASFENKLMLFRLDRPEAPLYVDSVEMDTTIRGIILSGIKRSVYLKNHIAVESAYRPGYTSPNDAAKRRIVDSLQAFFRSTVNLLDENGSMKKKFYGYSSYSFYYYDTVIVYIDTNKVVRRYNVLTGIDIPDANITLVNPKLFFPPPAYGGNNVVDQLDSFTVKVWSLNTGVFQTFFKPAYPSTTLLNRLKPDISTIYSEEKTHFYDKSNNKIIASLPGRIRNYQVNPGNTFIMYTLLSGEISLHKVDTNHLGDENDSIFFKESGMYGTIMSFVSDHEIYVLTETPDTSLTLGNRDWVKLYYFNIVTKKWNRSEEVVVPRSWYPSSLEKKYVKFLSTLDNYYGIISYKEIFAESKSVDFQQLKSQKMLF